MKKLCFILASSILLFVTACGNNNENDKNEKKAQNESSKKSEDSKSKKHTEDKAKENDKQNKDETSKSSNETHTAQNTEKANTTAKQQVNLNHITDRATLESVIYGNYSEMEKIQAYNNAVANGVIPQGNVMEGPASAAYQSSLRVESGAEKSVYDQHANAQQEAPTEDVNAEINAAQTKDEYINALRKKYNGGLSTEELQTKAAIEQGYYDGTQAEQQAIYNEIQQREADIKAGKYDQYKH